MVLSGVAAAIVLTRHPAPTAVTQARSADFISRRGSFTDVVARRQLPMAFAWLGPRSSKLRPLREGHRVGRSSPAHHGPRRRPWPGVVPRWPVYRLCPFPQRGPCRAHADPGLGRSGAQADRCRRLEPNCEYIASRVRPAQRSSFVGRRNELAGLFGVGEARMEPPTSPRSTCRPERSMSSRSPMPPRGATVHPRCRRTAVGWRSSAAAGCKTPISTFWNSDPICGLLDRARMLTSLRGDLTDAAWTSDGSAILFCRGAGVLRSLWRVARERSGGTGSRRRRRWRCSISSPAASSSGRLVFARRRRGSGHLPPPPERDTGLSAAGHFVLARGHPAVFARTDEGSLFNRPAQAPTRYGSPTATDRRCIL